MCGTYIRPEDLNAYENYVTSIEFVADTIEKEATLFQIYHNDKVWMGNLNLLLTNFDYNVDNRAINVAHPDFGATRATCGQKCMQTKMCKLCPTVFRFVTAIDKSRYKTDN